MLEIKISTEKSRSYLLISPYLENAIYLYLVKLKLYFVFCLSQFVIIINQSEYMYLCFRVSVYPLSPKLKGYLAGSLFNTHKLFSRILLYIFQYYCSIGNFENIRWQTYCVYMPNVNIRELQKCFKTLKNKFRRLQ